MKKFTLFTIILFIAFTPILYSQTYSFHFDKPVISQTTDGFSQIIYPNCMNQGKEGTPELPYRGIDLLLPYNYELLSATVVSVTFYPTEYGIKIKPASKPVPISHFNGIITPPFPDKTIYDSGDPYPAGILGPPATNYLCGHGIASFTLCPVIYIPANEEARFIQDITIKIKTHASARASEATRFLRTSPEVENRIRHIVDNPDVLGDYPDDPVRDNDDYDLLLISNSALMPSFDDYVSYKTSVGFLVKQVTTEEIYAQYSGDDDQEKIRNCIIDYYTNHGIRYVILGGDADPANPNDRIIPHRGLTAVDDDDIASDMYYSNLDGNWNNDGDNQWGEPGEADLYSEVSIGRLCVDNTTEIANFTHKLYMYQDAPVTADVEKALILGEQLDSQTWGGTYKDEIVNGSSNNGYTTTGFPDNFTITKLYDMSGGWDKTDIFHQFDDIGVNLMNHLGHSNVDYNMKMYNSDLTTTNFTNDGVTRGYVIGYSQGCYNGSFDNRNDYGYYGDDCFAEVFTGLETGEVAAIANSRYGWYDPGGTNSSSQYYDRQFFSAIFGDNITAIGRTNAASKEVDVSYINNDEYCRWVAYETNLFGDPSLDIWTAVPTDIIASYPVSITIGSSELPFETDAPYARIAVMQSGVLIGRAVADDDGNATVTFATLTDPAPLDVSIIAHNKNRHTGSVLVVSNQPYIIYQYYSIDDEQGNGNGVPDYGESILLSLALRNVGDQPAANANVTLSTTDPYITITDNSQFYGTIEAGEIVEENDAFGFDISTDVPDQHVVTFDIEIVAQDTWTASFSMVINAPMLTIGHFIINDTTGGNSNGNIDPGETVQIIVKSSNLGHSDCSDAFAQLTSTSEWLTVPETTDTIGDLPAGAEADATFTVGVDDYAPIGAYVDFNYQLISGDYSVENDYSKTIGLVFENWESGDFSKFAWTSTSTWPWYISHDGPYEGIFCCHSGDIGNSQASNMSLIYNCVSNDSVSFFKRISSEPEHDYLNFYIDDVMVGQWSGFTDWERVCFPVTPGVHTFKWEYAKDYEEKAGLDCAWVDYIVFPPTLVTTCIPGNDTAICENETYQCNATASNYTSLLWTTSGTGTFDIPDILTPVYSPSQQDYDSGSVTLSLTAFSNLPCGDITRSFVLTFNPLPAVPETPDGPTYVDLYYTSSSEYTIPPASDAVSYLWSLEPAEAGDITGDQTTGTVEWNAAFLGTASVSAKSINDCGESSFSEALEVEVVNTVGLDELNQPGFMSIYPNPNNGKFVLTFNASTNETASLDILNSFGRIIYSTKNIQIDQKASVELDLKNPVNGVYYLVLTTNERKEVRRFVIIK